MIDTADKARGALPDRLSSDSLAQFIGRAHLGGMFAGLAGALRREHVAGLLALNPDVLGFRGALCAGRDRTGRLEMDAIRAIRAAIPRALPSHSDCAAQEAPVS
jgi:uncharacterized protein (UPF0264 family)